MAATALLLLLVACSPADTTAAPAETAAAPVAPAEPTPSPTAEQAPSSAPDEPAARVDLPAGRSDEPLLPGSPALLVLGDSVGAGTGLAQARGGFAWRVHRALEEQRGGPYGLVNLAVPGATSASLNADQLPAAVQSIADGRVDTVVISVGGNDLLGLLDGPCQDLGGPDCVAGVEDAVAAFRVNLDHTMAALRAASPDVPIVVLGVYNPFDFGFGSSFERLAAQAAVALNAGGAEVAGAHGAAVADGYAALADDILETTSIGAAQADVHPTDLGHVLLAQAVLQALQNFDASGG